MSGHLLHCDGVVRRFGSVVALRGADVTTDPGDVILLAGANGAGKSTLLRVAAGLMRPDRGTVRVNARDLHRDPAARRQLGFLSHQTLLYDDLSARENLRFAAALHGLDHADVRVRDALDAAGLAQRADQRSGVLSHGTRQRLAIARATLHAPTVLLLDEPFSGLDRAAAELLRRVIAATAAAGGCVVCASHQPDDFWSLVTRVIALDQGAVAFDALRPQSLAEFDARFRPLVTA